MATYVLEVENATIPAISTFPVTNTITSAVGVHQTQTSSWLPSPSVVCTVLYAELTYFQFSSTSPLLSSSDIVTPILFLNNRDICYNQTADI